MSCHEIFSNPVQQNAHFAKQHSHIQKKLDLFHFMFALYLHYIPTYVQGTHTLSLKNDDDTKTHDDIQRYLSAHSFITETAFWVFCASFCRRRVMCVPNHNDFHTVSFIQDRIWEKKEILLDTDRMLYTFV